MGNKLGNKRRLIKYLLQRNGRWFYVRRVPKELKNYDSRTFVRVSLRTDSRTLAKNKAYALNAEVEQYWKELIVNHRCYSKSEFANAIKSSLEFGFTYLPRRLVDNDLLAASQRVV
jgi:hypothetical protein